MLEINPTSAGMVRHKYKIGDAVVWADTVDVAREIHLRHAAGVYNRCDPAAIERGRSNLLKSGYVCPDVTVLY